MINDQGDKGEENQHVHVMTGIRRFLMRSTHYPHLTMLNSDGPSWQSDEDLLGIRWRDSLAGWHST